MNWWEKYFGSEDYLLVEGIPRPALVQQCADFICEALEIGSGSRVLDVGCGMGRYSVALAERGCLVTAVDSSAYMIDCCRRLAVTEPRVTVQEADFREMSFDKEFDAVLCWGNSLGYESRDGDAQAIKRMVAALVPGGRIVIDLHNLAWYRENAVGKSWRETEKEFVLSDFVYEETEQRLVSRDIIVPKDGEPFRDYRAMYLEYKPTEIAQLLESCGAKEIEFYGDACAHEGGPLFSLEGYNEQSHMMIVVGRNERRYAPEGISAANRESSMC